MHKNCIDFIQSMPPRDSGDRPNDILEEFQFLNVEDLNHLRELLLQESHLQLSHLQNLLRRMRDLIHEGRYNLLTDSKFIINIGTLTELLSHRTMRFYSQFQRKMRALQGSVSDCSRKREIS